MKSKKPKKNTNLMNTCEGIISYPHCHKAHQFKEDDTPMFSAQLLIPENGKKSQKKFIKKLKAIVDAAAAEQWPKKKPKKMLVPYFHGSEADWDGDEDKEEFMSDKFVLKFKSKFGPIQVIDTEGCAVEEEDLYAGCIVRISFVAKAYDDPRNKGVSLYFKHVLKVDDGERIGGGPSASDQFSKYVTGQFDDSDD